MTPQDPVATATFSTSSVSQRDGIIGWCRPDTIFVPTNRQRQKFKAEAHDELIKSILEDGLISPLIVDMDDKRQITLVAGERRLRACKEIFSRGGIVKLVNGNVEPGCVPVIVLSEQPERIRRRIELSENINRLDLTWQEKVKATNEIIELFRLDDPTISIAEIAKRSGIDGASATSRQTIGDHMHLPSVINAPSEKDAKKAVVKHMQDVLASALAIRQLESSLAGDLSPASRHTLIKGEASSILIGLETRFDVVLTDPPYGIGAHDYSHNNTLTVQHNYDDSSKTLDNLLAFLPALLTRVSKEQAHLYLFCDMAQWAKWRDAFEARGWEVYRQPMIWVKGRGGVGSADVWPYHAYEGILYAVRGRKVTMGKLASDVLIYDPVPSRQHAAQKPVALYEDLIRRSALLNDRILDCFCGSGTIFEACDRAGTIATGIDIDIALAQRRLAGEREITE
jgi:DNA modification methylase